jgi:hypothetical protein
MRSSTGNHWYRHLDSDFEEVGVDPKQKKVIVDRIEDWTTYAFQKSRQQLQQNHVPNSEERHSDRRVQLENTNDNIITHVHELRRKVLDELIPLRQLKVRIEPSTVDNLQQHAVVQLIAQRFHSQSKPGQRDSNDTAKLALSLEGTYGKRVGVVLLFFSVISSWILGLDFHF